MRTRKFLLCVPSRGGVEDTRLQAKAKNTKIIRGQGQGQPYRGQTLSRPRTGMLEAKDTSASALQKKVFRKNFQAIPRKKLFQKIFQALHKLLTTLKKVLSLSRGGGNFRKLEQARSQDFEKGGGLF